MYYKKRVTPLILAMLVLLTACSPSDTPSINKVTASEASQMVENNNAIIIDVRNQSEWDAGHIPGAIHIPLSEVKDRIPELIVYKDRPLVMQCYSGKRSAKAAGILQQAGFDNVSNMTGGISAWSAAKLPLEK